MEPADAQAARSALVNYEAEQAVLSALLGDNGAYDRVCDFLDADHFADAVHGRIYAAIAAEIQRGSKANAITLNAAFDSDPALQNVGGGDYLYQLQNAHVASLNARHYGAVVYDLSRRRALVSHLRDVLERAETADVVDDDADAICGDALESLDGIQQTGAAERTQRPAVDVAAELPADQAVVAFEGRTQCQFESELPHGDEKGRDRQKPCARSDTQCFQHAKPLSVIYTSITRMDAR